MSTTDRKLRVFLCHASQDKPTVRELYQRLLAEGWIDPWLDEEKLLPGQEWDMEIKKAVETADAVLVCISDDAVKKEGYIQKELRFALEIALEKPEETIFIIPIRLNDCFMPKRLKEYHYQDYFPANKIEKTYKRLCNSLELRAKKLDINVLSLRRRLQEKKEKARLKAEKRKKRNEEKRALAREKAREEERRKIEEIVRINREKENARKEEERIKKEEERQQKEAAELAKKEAEEKARKEAARRVRKIERDFVRKWSAGQNLLGQPEFIDIPAKIFEKKKLRIELLKWPLILSIVTILFAVSVFIFRMATQVGVWWAYCLFILWIIFAFLIGIFLSVGFYYNFGTSEAKKIKYGIVFGNILMFLAENGILAELNLTTSDLTVLDYSYRRSEKFVVDLSAHQIFFETGTVFDFANKKRLGRLNNFKDYYQIQAYNSATGYFLIKGFNSILLMDSKTNRIHKEYRSKYSVESLQISQDGWFIVAGCQDSRSETYAAFSAIQIWHRRHGEIFHSMPAFERTKKMYLRISPDSTLLGVGCEDTVLVYSLTKNEIKLELKLNERSKGWINSLAFIAKGKLLIVGMANSLAILDVESGNYIYVAILQNNLASSFVLEDLTYIPERQELIGIDAINGRLCIWPIGNKNKQD